MIHAKHKPVVDFIGDDKEIKLERQRRNRLEFGSGKNLAGRIVRRVEDQEFCAARAGISQLLEVQCPTIFCRLELHVNWYSLGQKRLRGVRVEFGFHDDDLVARIDQCLHGGV